MDHRKQRQQQHHKEREKRLAHEKEIEREKDQQPRRIHPAWFVGLGIGLIGLVVLIWILVA
jgi:type VI protein secretion system component VasF